MINRPIGESFSLCGVKKLEIHRVFPRFCLAWQENLWPLGIPSTLQTGPRQDGGFLGADAGRKEINSHFRKKIHKFYTYWKPKGRRIPKFSGFVQYDQRLETGGAGFWPEGSPFRLWENAEGRFWRPKPESSAALRLFPLRILFLGLRVFPAILQRSLFIFQGFQS